MSAGGAEVAVGGAARAWLSADVDGDLDEDLLVLVERDPPEGSVARTLELASFERDGTELRSAGAASLPEELADRCALETVGLRLAAPGTFTLSVATRCASVRSGLAAIGSAGPPAQIRLAARADGTAVGVEVGAQDRDGDGQPDALLTVSVPSGRAELVYSERVAGYGLVAGSIERSLAAVAAAPRSRVDREERLRKARAVIALRRLLCEGEVDGVHLTIDGRPPRECDPSRSVGRAITEIVRTSLAAGDVPGARGALSLLQLPGVALGEQARSALEQSVSERMALGLEHSYSRGPSVDSANLSQGGPRRIRLRFLDEDRVLIAGPQAVVYVTSTAQIEPAEPIEDRVRSPDGRLVVWGMERGCGGHRATLCGADADCSSAPPASAIRIAGNGLGPEYPGCRGPTRDQITEPGLPDVAVLAWRAPGGLIVQDGLTLREVRVSDSGRPLGEPRALGIPAELPPGSPFGAGGRRQAIGRAEGLWIRDLSQWALIPAATVGGAWTDARAIALSPSGDVVAAIRSGHLDLVRLRTNGAAAAP